MVQTFGQKFKGKLILILARHLPPCKEMVKLFSDARERKLTFREKSISKLHLFTCQACRRYVGQIAKMSEVVKEKEQNTDNSQLPFKLSDDARTRIKTAIEKRSEESSQ